MPSPPAGLCDTCRHQREVRNTRGSRFSLCERSKDDPSFPRYPRLPVIECRGYEYGAAVDGYEITTDPARLDVDLIHRYLSEESYWARGVPRDVVERSIASSICFGLLRDGATVGFARVVSDRATFAWLADVFVLESERARGLGVRLVEAALGHPELQGLRRWLLATADAHDLYRRFGFEAADERKFMERHVPYARPS